MTQDQYSTDSDHWTPFPTEDWNEPFLGLHGRTRAYNDAAAQASWALIQHILRHERFEEIVHKFATISGLHSIADECQSIWLHLWELLGDDNYEAFRDGQCSFTLSIDEDEQSDVQVELQGLVDSLAEALDRYLTLMENLPDGSVDSLFSDITFFVKEDLRLPWAWVAYDLLEDSFLAIAGKITAQNMSRNDIWVINAEPTAPDIDLKFVTLENETLGQFSERFAEIVGNVFDEIANAEREGNLPTGKSLSPEVIVRSVDWYYRNHVIGESKNHIAKQDKFDRKQVRTDIRRAEGLLSVRGAFWNDFPEEEALKMGEDYWKWPDDDDAEPAEGGGK